ncbi:unnamed protein product [Bemisia tabaci]|uniref:TGF-beta-activated kinase 1 and MAP3K7-binding protein 1 n=1 Tax=Bemisia tabaci TaxID=7038 RepID=A0A9P0AIJ4_BEMTA|nr:unnamed protein product [Bemisia tabaci]
MMPSSSRLGVPPTLSSQTSWTDDLPVCRNSGAGFSTNQIYQEDGHRREEHPFEDQCFHCRSDENTSLYCVFDGHEGVSAAEFALQRMAAELLLGQLEDARSDADVQEILRQAFNSVEKSYMETMDDLVAEKTSLIFEIPDGLTSYEAYQKYPRVVEKLNSINTELSCGTTAVAALVHNNKLFVANVGDSRALLCKTDPNGVLKVVQLSVDHDLSNQDEVLRLAQLGLSLDKLKAGMRLGNQENTRCLGNYLVKGGYKEFEDLSPAISEPVLADPEIHETIPLDESCRFLMLMSDGLYKSLEEASGSGQVNQELALLAVEQFQIQSTLTGVAQAVVDKVVRIHHDTYMTKASKGDLLTGGKRDDITLLIRNFNYPMPRSLTSGGPHVRFDPVPTITNYPRADPESDAADELEQLCKELLSTLAAMDDKASLKKIYPLLDKLLSLVPTHNVKILTCPVVFPKSYLNFSQVIYPRILSELVRLIKPPISKNVLHLFVLENGNPYTLQAALSVLSDVLKGTKPSIYQDSIIDIIEKLVKSEALTSAIILKSLSKEFDDISWKEMIQILVSVPNRIANSAETKLPKYCIPSNFVKIIFCHVIKAIKILKEARNLCKIEDEKPLSLVVSKTVSNYGTVNLDMLITVFEEWIVQDDNYQYVIHSLVKHLDRISIEPILISILQKVSNLTTLVQILPSSLLDSQNWTYVLMNKIPFMTYYSNNQILTNYISFLGKNDKLNVLNDLIVKLLKIWGDKSALNHTSFEQHLYVSKLILLGINFRYRCNQSNESFRKEIERQLLSAVPLHLDSSDEKIRAIGMVLSESVTGYFWKPTKDDSIKKLEFNYTTMKNESKAIVEELKTLADFKFVFDTQVKTDPEMEDLLKHFEAVIKVNDESFKERKEPEIIGNVVDGDLLLDSDDDLEPYDLSNDVKLSVKKQPKYLRDLKEALMEDKDYDVWSAAVDVCEDLIKTQLPNEDVSFALDLVQLLISSEAQFYSEKFDDARFSSCVAIVMVYPNEVATLIGQQFHEVVNRYSIAQRLLMLDILAESAKQLSSPHLKETNKSLEKEKDVGCMISEKIRANTRRKCRPKIIPKLKINEYSKACGSFFFPLIRGSLKNKEIMFRKKENNSANNIDDCNLLLVHFLNTLAIIMMAAVNCAKVTRMAAELLEFVWWLRYHAEVKVRLAVIHCFASVIFAVPSSQLLSDLITELSEIKIWLEEIVSSGGIASRNNEVDSNCRVFASQVLMFINFKMSDQFEGLDL